MLIRYLLLPFGFTLLAVTNAQTSNLADWSEAAFDRHPDRQLAVSEQVVGEALNLKAGQWLADDPSANLKYQTDSIGSDIGYDEWEGGVDLPLWWPGQRDRYQVEANSSLALAGVMLEAKRLEIAGIVRQRLWNVLLARAERDQAAQSLEADGKLLDDVSRKVSAGELPRSDRLLAEKIVLQAEDALQQAENKLTQHLARFESYTGFQGEIKAHPEQPVMQLELDNQHKFLRLAEYQVDKARAHRDRVSGERRSGPSLWLGGKTVKVASGTDYLDSVGVELSIPFGGKAHAAPADARAEQALTEAIAERNHTHHELEEALLQAQLELERTTNALARAERHNSIAEESVTLSRRAFDLGETDLLRLLQAQTDANDARQGLILTRLQRDRSISILNQAFGVLPQ